MHQSKHISAYYNRITRAGLRDRYYTDEVDEAGSGEPDTDERRDELTQSDAVGRLEHVEIL